MIDVVVGHGSALTRGTLRAALEDAGCAVRESASASALLSDCQAEPPDVVLITPDLCARESIPLLARLKQDPDLFSVAVILVEEPRPPQEVLHDLERGIHDVILTPIRDADVVARVRAAARTKALQEEYLNRGRVMEELVYGDPLTGLFNRRFMFGQLAAAVAGARRHGRELAVCMIDIDHFKDLNDELGHTAGDQALVQVAQRLTRRVRREDHLGRVGGEEFVLILPETGEKDAACVAEDLRVAVGGKPMVVDGLSRTVTVSIGWAAWDRAEEPDELLRRADEAMYGAKAAGRDRVCAADGPPRRFERPPSPRTARR